MWVTGSVAQADTLFDNVQGITLDEEGRVERFVAVLVGNDGTIEQVYRRGEDLPRDVDYHEDGRGRVMMPGLFDAHVHVMGIGFGALTLDLSQTRSLEEAQAAIAAYVAENPDRPWILGRGWNQELWGLGRFPTAAELDAVVPDRPVWLERVDGHAAWANSKALEIAGITADSVAPTGGRIERLADGKTPSGVFVDAAMELVQQAVMPPRPVDRDLALVEAQKILAAQGIVAVADMGTTIEDWQSFRRAGDAGSLYVRIVSYAAGIDNMVLIGGPGPSPWLYQDRLKLAGVKLYLDGALGSRGAWLKEPYSDAPGQAGLPLLTPAQLRNLMSRAALSKFQIAVHAIGDAANADVLNAIDDLDDTYEGDRRWRIEHAQIVDPADLARFGALDVITSMQPLHQTSDMFMAEARLGPDRLDGAYAWKSILEGRAVLAFGSDAPVEPADAFAGLAVAMSRQNANGQPFGGWRSGEALNFEQALAGFTTGAAYAAFAEDRLGRIAPGLRADFLFVDRDPTMASPSQLRDTRVLETWIGGRKVYDASAAN
ncbi:amidohydrolase [Pseudoblastomonas halimionae]|uniref:Amidohydrolase family protein n=1 Tax=Alteriqipengyuania halimionae TaxID=1926630 RepID=A0A6I4U474_9SPHN|nr:amidohydrolase [Alteriqipengyuania halimionae]MXP10164.1 amidohydrolase family protein [Alteriqipengyuania halimionae]